MLARFAMGMMPRALARGASNGGHALTWGFGNYADGNHALCNIGGFPITVTWNQSAGFSPQPATVVIQPGQWQIFTFTKPTGWYPGASATFNGTWSDAHGHSGSVTGSAHYT